MLFPKKRSGGPSLDFSSYPVGTGPFTLTKWRNNNEVVLVRNERYFAGPAKTKGLVYRVIPEDLTAMTEFELGNLDVITLPASEYSGYKNSSQWKGYLSSVYGLNIYYLGFNCSRPPFDNINLRKAVSFAIDREKILKTFYENRGRLAQGPVPDMLRKWQVLFPYAYNPREAKRIIDAEGIKDRTILFYITADQEVIDMAEIIQSYLSKVGLRVRIKQLEWSAYKSAVNNGEADMFWLSWWADYPDPENFLFPLFHSSNHGAGGNRSRYTNKEVDRLIEAGQWTSDISKRNGYYGLAEKIIDEDAPWVFFWHKTDFTLRQPSLKNYKIYPIYSIDKGYRHFILKIYVFRKIALLIPMLLGITLITFILTNALPGDPVYSMVGERANPQTVEKIRKAIGTDKGVVRQYIGYVSLLLSGEMGRSYYTNREVLDEIIAKLPNTLRLAAGAMCIAVPFGILLGLVSAIRKNSISDRMITFFSIYGTERACFLERTYVYAPLQSEVETIASFRHRGPEISSPACIDIGIACPCVNRQGNKGFCP